MNSLRKLSLVIHQSFVIKNSAYSGQQDKTVAFLQQNTIK
jgi:hypothetical protein